MGGSAPVRFPPDRAARGLLTVIDRDPESVVRALAGAEETRAPAPSARRLAAAERTPERSAASTSGSPGRALEDATLAELHEQGRAPSSASPAVWPAARFRARLAGEPSPAGERTAPGPRGPTGGPPSSAAGARRAPSGRQTWPPSSPPASGGGVESAASSPSRSPSSLDAVIAGLLFMAGMRSKRGERPPVGRRRRRRDAGDGPPRQDEPGGRDEGTCGS